MAGTPPSVPAGERTRRPFLTTPSVATATPNQTCLFPELFAPEIRRSLSVGAKRLLELLTSYSKLAAGAFPFQATLAAKLGCHARTVRKWLQELKAAGIAAVSKRGRTSALYTVEKTVENEDKGRSKGRSKGFASLLTEGKTLEKTKQAVVKVPQSADPRALPAISRQIQAAANANGVGIPAGPVLDELTRQSVTGEAHPGRIGAEFGAWMRRAGRRVERAENPVGYAIGAIRSMFGRRVQSTQSCEEKTMPEAEAFREKALQPDSQAVERADWPDSPKQAGPEAVERVLTSREPVADVPGAFTGDFVLLDKIAALAKLKKL